jgi:hypothetical protein
MPPAGPLCSTGVTPLRRSYGPIRQALAFAALRLPARAATLLHGLSPWGEEPFPASTHGLVCMLPSFTPPGDGPRRSRSRASVAFAGFLTARLPDFRLTRPRPDVHSSLRPAHLLTSPGEALSVGFTAAVSRAGATPATRLRSSTASGLSPYGSMGSSRHHRNRPGSRSISGSAGAPQGLPTEPDASLASRTGDSPVRGSMPACAVPVGWATMKAPSPPVQATLRPAHSAAYRASCSGLASAMAASIASGSVGCPSLHPRHGSLSGVVFASDIAAWWQPSPT